MKLATIKYLIAYTIVCLLLGATAKDLVLSEAIPEPVYKPTKTTQIKHERYVYRIYGHTYDKTIPAGTAFKLRFKNRTYLMSAEHVCEVFQEPSPFKPVIETEYGLVTTRIVAISADKDLCLLEVPSVLNRDDKLALKLADRIPNITNLLFTVGFPGGRPKTIVYGQYVGRAILKMPKHTDYTYHDKELHFMNYPAIPGQSGSPVMNKRGDVIGVLVVLYHNLSGFVSLESVLEFLGENYQ
jgi:S1-C subfamily serine protease